MITPWTREKDEYFSINSTRPIKFVKNESNKMRVICKDGCP